MRITLYNIKGGAGKTPISTNITLDREYAIGTNQVRHIYDGFIPEERLLAVDMEEKFPDIPDDIDIVFDLAGSISAHSYSISSALKQSDLVIVPIEDEFSSIDQGIYTIEEAVKITKASFLVVTTKIETAHKEKIQGGDWSKSKAFLNIKEQVGQALDFEVPVLPLKYSKVFKAVIEQELSIRQLMDAEPLAVYNYRLIAKQFDAIYEHIDMVRRNAEQKQRLHA